MQFGRSLPLGLRTRRTGSLFRAVCMILVLNWLSGGSGRAIRPRIPRFGAWLSPGRGTPTTAHSGYVAKCNSGELHPPSHPNTRTITPFACVTLGVKGVRGPKYLQANDNKDPVPVSLETECATTLLALASLARVIKLC